MVTDPYRLLQTEEREWADRALSILFTLSGGPDPLLGVEARAAARTFLYGEHTLVWLNGVNDRDWANTEALLQGASFLAASAGSLCFARWHEPDPGDIEAVPEILELAERALADGDTEESFEKSIAVLALIRPPVEFVRLVVLDE